MKMPGGRLQIFGTARAILDLMRIDLVTGAGIFVVAGEMLGSGGVPPWDTVLLGFLTGFFISGSANISNDYFDREVDRINRPDRPLPSGRISAAGLWALFLLFAAAGLGAAALLSPLVLALAAGLFGTAFLYNIKCKEMGLFGNLIVAFCVGMTVITGGAATGAISGVVLTFAALAFLFDLGEEIAADAMDARGDELRSVQSLAQNHGRAFALRVSGILFLLFIALTFVPLLLGWFGYLYLFLVVAADAGIAYCSLRLVRSTSGSEGGEMIRRLYLIWGIFVLAVIVTTFLFAPDLP